MAWYWIVLIALGAYSAIGTIIAVWGKDEWLEAWAIGFVGLLLWLILYILGKRAKEED